MNRLAKESLLGNIDKIELSTCEYCLTKKTTRKLFRKGIRAEAPLQLIHYNIYNPMNIRATDDAIYFITFINNFTRFRHVYLISQKSEALSYSIKFIKLVENHLEKLKLLGLIKIENTCLVSLKGYVMKRKFNDS